MYYLQSRYYNPEWGRFINADALIGQTGELLGHNMFAYCKNNPVNRKDDSGFVSSHVSYDIGEGTYTSQNLSKSAVNSAKEVGKGSIVSASEESLNRVTIYSSTTKVATRKSTRIISEVTLSAKHLGTALKIAGGISTGISIVDNFSGKYSITEAIVRSVLDAGGFTIGALFLASGGWGALLGGVALAGGVELGKIFVNYVFNNMPALKQNIGLSL